MAFKKGNIPLYFQIYLQLKQEIISGDRPPGSPIPTINELAEQTGVSHGMIRRALELLEMESLIIKKPRVGTVVRESPQKALWVPTSSLDDFRQRLELGAIRFLSDGFVDPPNRVMVHFDSRDEILQDGKIYENHFLLISSQDQSRIDLARMFVPLWRFNQVPLDQWRKAPLASAAMDVDVARIRQVTRPWFCDHYASEHLQVPDGTPIFHRTIIAYLPDHKPLGVLELLTNINAMEREIIFS
ncbi:transcriptional regulator, GntR family [Desulfatibacillum aliphaticivorans]|uniref:Transcriptional regulator, GntR family n=1 Tax=Desulfatibacillum aliphaticivorans TaxID=218208 RepID=B8FFL1_DESAL|nr:GntR family transcriptional regulator [Desulfatibacillum aliphaticivorans]ACL04271.1 transcriptional regulator, GntR family [Desulfatibacillum aliphaticivorans]